MAQTDATGQLSWLLDNLVNQVEHVEQAVILSTDGLVVASSRTLAREDGEHLSALACGLQSLAQGAGLHFRDGNVRQIIIELEKAFLLITGAEDIASKMRSAHIHDWHEAVSKGIITQAEGHQIAAAHEAAAKVIEVDDFPPEALSPNYKKPAEVHRFFQELGETRAAS